jgi:hypothetical protein
MLLDLSEASTSHRQSDPVKPAKALQISAKLAVAMSDDLLRRLGKLAEKRGVGIILPLAAGHRQELELLSLNQPMHGSV